MGAVSDPEHLVRVITAAGVSDARVLDAVRAVPRAGFVPPHLAGRAYQDEPLTIPRGQVTTQPSLVARMVEALGLEGSERVLEVGAGYGWQTALLARLCGFVWAVERFADVAEAARENLTHFGVANAEVVEGDGTEGLSENGPRNLVRLQVVAGASFVKLHGAHAFPEE